MTTADQRTKGWLMVGIQAALLALLILGPDGSLWPVPGWLRTAGDVLKVLGLLAVLAGAIGLGRSLSAHPKPAERASLQTGGPYRFVRHPIYTGVMVLAAGIAATSASGWVIGAFAGLVVLFSIKARFEEKLLTARFDGYRRYAAITPRFLPRIRGH